MSRPLSLRMERWFLPCIQTCSAQHKGHAFLRVLSASKPGLWIIKSSRVHSWGTTLRWSHWHVCQIYFQNNIFFSNRQFLTNTVTHPHTYAPLIFSLQNQTLFPSIDSDMISNKHQLGWRSLLPGSNPSSTACPFRQVGFVSFCFVLFVWVLCFSVVICKMGIVIELRLQRHWKNWDIITCSMPTRVYAIW